jgi:hypothetical protein
MLKSIERSAAASCISLDDVDFKKGAPWGGKNLFDKAEVVGLGGAYLAAFGGHRIACMEIGTRFMATIFIGMRRGDSRPI